MLENNNRKFIRTLSRNCMKANKMRNLIAIFAIILTTVLFTSVGTILEGAMQTIKEQRIRQSGTKFMLSMKYLPEEASEKLLSNPAFSEIGKMQYFPDISVKRYADVRTVENNWYISKTAKEAAAKTG